MRLTDQTGKDASEQLPIRRSDRRFSLKVAPLLVGLALVSALASFAVFTGYTPLFPTDPVVLDVFIADGVIACVLFLLVGLEAFKLLAAWRAKQAGARLHAYIVVLFSITAAVPAIIMAVVGAVALDRGLYPAFVDDVGRFIAETKDAGKLIRSKQCDSLQRDADLTASDLERARVGYTDRNFFQNYFDSRVHSLGFTTAVIMDAGGKITERVDTGQPAQVVKPSAADLAGARTGEQVCFRLDGGRSFVVLRFMPTFSDSFLYVGRPLDPFTIAFQQHAEDLTQLFKLFDAYRGRPSSSCIAYWR